MSMKWGDYGIACASLVYIVLLYTSYWQPAGRAGHAQIRTPYEKIELSLLQPQTVAIRGKLGNSILQVDSNGRIRFTSSPCVNQYCVHSGWLQDNGDITACLPNGITVALQGEHPAYDAINF